jgi:hypothetical protein
VQRKENKNGSKKTATKLLGVVGGYVALYQVSAFTDPTAIQIELAVYCFTGFQLLVGHQLP